jgi:hypothetical protein
MVVAPRLVLPDVALVCRGGTCSAERFRQGAGVSAVLHHNRRPGCSRRSSRTPIADGKRQVDTNTFQGITDEELNRIEARLRDATAGPWTSYVEGRDHDSGSSFIQTPSKDIELSGATVADAHAREDLPRLLIEVRRLRAPAS